MSHIVEVNAQTGKVTERPMTEAEIKQLADDAKEAALIKQKAADKLAAQASILAKLGLTQDEAKILLG